MSRTPSPTPPFPTKAAPPPAKPKESIRDLLDQVAIAFMMAILIKGLEAEAFVIPTGSMAPTLMGRHKEITCPQCGWVYAVNASEDTEEFIRSRRLADFGICGNCRFRTKIDDTPSFKGDRILVMKFPYEIPRLPGSADPKRWDVVVFHYPEKPETNYIKRLVGLPGDDLRLNHGDVQVRPAGTNEAFRIERKPLYHQDAMQMLVYDDRYRPRAFEDKPEWRRWRGLDAEAGGAPAGTPAAWAEPTPGTYAVEAGGDFSRLGYRHLVPDPDQWDAASAGSAIPRAPRATLITDFYAYNTNISPNYGDLWLQMFEGYLQPNWVGDLTVEGRVEVRSADPGATLRLELVEAGVVNRCEIDLATGTATISHGEAKLGEAPTRFVGAGAHDLRLANVDDRLTLTVDGATPFGEGLAYDDAGTDSYIPTARDLAPVTIAVRGAKVQASGLVLHRDIYYTQDPRDPDYKAAGVYEGIDRNDASDYGRVLKLMDFLGDPARFGEFRDLTAHRNYVVRPDHYLMLGDNSPRSADSRAWRSDDASWRGDVERSDWEVPRSLLIGKAFFIYWPHGKPFGPDIRLSPDFRVPFRPYFERMHWIR